MSHIQECRQTPGCDVEALREADGLSFAQEALGVAVVVGLVAAGAALTIWFVRKARRLEPEQRGILYEKVLFVAGIICVLVGLPLTGLVVGFAVSFGSCFKSACSVFESSAGLTFPVAGLLLAVPLAVVMLRRLRALPRLD
jgi:hypothetical protein